MTTTALTPSRPTGLVEQLMQEHLPPPRERRRRRKAVGATLRHVADELRVSETAVSYWERGICEPGPRHRVSYRKMLDDFEALERSITARLVADGRG